MKKFMSVTWDRQDIVKAAEMLSGSVVLSDSEICDVLCAMENGHDANIGINWTVIQEHIKDVLRKRP